MNWIFGKNFDQLGSGSGPLDAGKKRYQARGLESIDFARDPEALGRVCVESVIL